MRFVIITGPSGAGKTAALHSFEDAGYFTVDNLPPRLLEDLIAFCREDGRDRAAVVIDTRCGPALAELPDVLADLNSAHIDPEVLYLDASDDVLVQRFKETRRPHPLMDVSSEQIRQGGIIAAIAAERELLLAARGFADRVVDTSSLSALQLRDSLHRTYAGDACPGLLVSITSFGFKHGLPVDADLVFDVRFLANPYYVPILKAVDGRDSAVAEYVHADPRAAIFERKMEDLVRFALPQYAAEGKAYVNIAIGCTGGRHRSVVLAEDLAASVRGDGYSVVLRHRDIPEETAPDRREPIPMPDNAPSGPDAPALSTPEERR